MKILICGATGLIGKKLSNLCIENGHVVHFLTRNKKAIQQKENYKGFYWNPKQQEIDADCLEGVETIINLSGASIAKRWTPSYKQEIINSRILSAKLLFDTIQLLSNHTIQHYVSASAIGIYPNSQAEEFKEDAPQKDDDFLSEVVIAWEAEANRFRELELNVSIIRIGLVLAKNGGALAEIIKPIKYGVGAALGNGKQWQSWIHVNDIVRLILHITTQKQYGVFNGVASNPVTNKQLTKEIAKQLKRPLFMPNIPQSLMKVILGEMSILLFSSQKVSSQKIRATGFEFQYEEISVALENLLEK